MKKDIVSTLFACIYSIHILDHQHGYTKTSAWWIKRSLLAVVRKKINTIWVQRRTLYFVMNNLAHCSFTLNLFIACHHAGKPNSTVIASKNASVCYKLKSIKIHAYVNVEKQKNLWWSLPTALVKSQGVRRNWGSFYDNLISNPKLDSLCKHIKTWCEKNLSHFLCEAILFAITMAGVLPIRSSF